MVRREEAVYMISVAAELAGVHPQTLRIYERKGLLEPYRTPGGTRRYSAADLERLELIQELTAAGVNLEGVRRILSLQSENERLRGQVERLRRVLDKVEKRAAGEQPAGRTIIKMGAVVKRNLPDVRRKPPLGR